METSYLTKFRIVRDLRCASFMAILLPLVVSAQNEVASFSLIDADENVVIAGFDPIADDATINLNTLPTANLNVRANVADEEGATQSLIFSLSGATTAVQTESAAPYALAGDNGGNYNAFNFNPGSHSLTATPYDDNSGNGTAGTPLTIQFTVMESLPTLPTVSITSPVNGSSIAPPANLTITADASDPDGTVAQVEFFEGGSSLGLVTTAPYAVDLTGLPEGSYSYTAVATDNDGNTASSTSVSVTVAESSGTGVVDGELKKWHKVSVTFDGPSTSEGDEFVNPFLDYRLDVVFTGPSGQSYAVPGYYAADGNAANTGASAGNKWRVHFAPVAAS